MITTAALLNCRPANPLQILIVGTTWRYSVFVSLTHIGLMPFPRLDMAVTKTDHAAVIVPGRRNIPIGVSGCGPVDDAKTAVINAI